VVTGGARRLGIAVAKDFFAEALWTPILGGTYSVAKDRDFYRLEVGATL
jgi:hypothetical protein